jgi:DNA repair protein RecO (recombination protein O)
MTLHLGSFIQGVWCARLEGQIGFWKLETLPSPHIVTLLNQPRALTCLVSLCYLCYDLLPERHPYPTLFSAFSELLQKIAGKNWILQVTHFEGLLLQALGYGLDLRKCVSCQNSSDLQYVSPKSGGSVCIKCAEPYKNQLLIVPPFLLEFFNKPLQSPFPEIPERDLIAAFRLHGYFFKRHFSCSRGVEQYQENVIESFRRSLIS